nr:HAD family hydrolase [Spirochaetales bacterium]
MNSSLPDIDSISHIHAVVFDLDGTLLNSRRELTSNTIRAVSALMERGIFPVIATGRSYQAVLKYKGELKISTPVICYNGSVIYNSTTGEEQHSVTLPEDIARAAIRHGRKNNLHTQGFRHGQLCHERVTADAEYYQEVTGLKGKIVNFDNYNPLELTKLMYVSSEREKITRIAKYMDAEYWDRQNQCYS